MCKSHCMMNKSMIRPCMWQKACACHNGGPKSLAPSSSKSESSSAEAGAAATAGAACDSAGTALLPMADEASALPAASAVRAAWADPWAASSCCAVVTGATLRMGLSTSPLSILRRCLESSSGFTCTNGGPERFRLEVEPLEHGCCSYGNCKQYDIIVLLCMRPTGCRLQGQDITTIFG